MLRLSVRVRVIKLELVRKLRNADPERHPWDRGDRYNQSGRGDISYKTQSLKKVIGLRIKDNFCMFV